MDGQHHLFCKGWLFSVHCSVPWRLFDHDSDLYVPSRPLVVFDFLDGIQLPLNSSVPVEKCDAGENLYRVVRGSHALSVGGLAFVRAKV